MTISIWPVLAATAAMFAVGGFWYSIPFREAWSKIHGFNKLSKAEQDKLMKETGPLYLFQVVFTVISAWALAKLMVLLPGYSPFTLAGLVWFGFVLPAQVSSVLFSRTDKQYKLQQIAIMAGEAILHLEVAAWVLKTLMK